MICKPCGDAKHSNCYDVEHGTEYRSCTCQHRPRSVESYSTGIGQLLMISPPSFTKDDSE